jgi:hypothetical protein
MNQYLHTLLKHGRGQELQQFFDSQPDELRIPINLRCHAFLLALDKSVAILARHPLYESSVHGAEAVAQQDLSKTLSNLPRFQALVRLQQSDSTTEEWLIETPLPPGKASPGRVDSHIRSILEQAHAQYTLPREQVEAEIRERQHLSPLPGAYIRVRRTI